MKTSTPTMPRRGFLGSIAALFGALYLPAIVASPLRLPEPPLPPVGTLLRWKREAEWPGLPGSSFCWRAYDGATPVGSTALTPTGWQVIMMAVSGVIEPPNVRYGTLRLACLAIQAHWDRQVSPAPVVATPKVKPLVWVNSTPEHNNPRWVTYPIPGVWIVTGKWNGEYWLQSSVLPVGIDSYPTLEAAKTAAQAIWDAAVLSALENS